MTLEPLYKAPRIFVILQEKLDFLHLPVMDGHVTSDAAMHRLVDDCCLRLLKGGLSARTAVVCLGTGMPRPT